MTPNDSLRAAKEALSKAIETETRSRNLLAAIGPAIIGALRPVLDEILSTFKQTSSEMRDSISQIKIDTPQIPEIRIPPVEVRIPEIKVPEPRVTVNVSDIPAPIIPEIKIPKIVVPKPEITVNVPPIKIPRLEWPEDEMSVKGWVQLMGVDLNHPLPVQLRDSKGNPIKLFDNLTQIIQGGGGVAAKIVKVSGFGTSAFSEITNPDGRVKVELPTGSSGLTDSELRASSIPVEQVSGSNWSVNVVSGSTAGTQYNDGASPDQAGGTGTLMMVFDGASTQSRAGSSYGVGTVQVSGFDGSLVTVSSGSFNVNVADAFGSTVVGSVFNGDNRLRVSVETGGSGLTDSELRAAHLDVVQMSGSVDSVNMLQIGSNAVVVGSGYQDNALRVVNATDATTSVYVNNPFGQGDSATGLRIIQAGDSISSVSVVSNIAALDVKQVSGSVDSVNVLQWNGNTVTVGTGYSDNALRIVHATDVVASVYVNNPFAQGDSATALRTIQAGDSVSSVYANNPFGQGDTATALRVVHAGDSAASVFATNPIAQGDVATALRVVIAGNSDSSVSVTSITGPIAQGDAASALRVVIAGNSDASVTATLVANSTVNVNGALNSVIVTGPNAVGSVDDGTAPVQISGISRTANPTAITGGGITKFSTDDLGRQLIRPVQARDLVATAYVTATTGTETTLLAATAGAMFDLIYIMCANQSDAAVSIDFRGVLAGNVLFTVQVPASGTSGVSLPVPIPQTGSDTGNAWTYDMPDITGTTVNISALFSKEI